MSGATDEKFFNTAFKRALEAELDPSSELCPLCAARPISKEKEARSLGVCSACLSRARLDAYRAATLELSLRKQRAAARQERSKVLGGRGDAE